MTASRSRYDGTSLHVESWGRTGAPSVVLVPGLGESIRSWGRVPELLESGHHVVAFDLRGHGRSGVAAGGDYELRAHVADLATVLAEAVPLDGPCPGRFLPPSLVLWGEIDRQDTRTKVDEVAAALPDAQVVALEGVSHTAPLTHPDLVAEHIARCVRVTSAPKGETPAQEVAP